VDYWEEHGELEHIVEECRCYEEDDEGSTAGLWEGRFVASSATRDGCCKE